MDVAEPAVWRFEGLEWSLDMAVDLGLLALGARSGPVTGVFCHATPDELLTEEFPCGTDPRVCEAMKDVKNCVPPRSGDHGSATPHRGVAEESDMIGTLRDILEMLGDAEVATAERLSGFICSLGSSEEAEIDTLIDHVDPGESISH